MNNHVPPPLIEGPLKFGDAAQINEIRRYEKELDRSCDPTLCPECTGEGMIECPECLGSGEKKKKF